MFLLISYFSGGKRPGRKPRKRRKKPVTSGQRDARQLRNFEAQIRRARPKFMVRYDDWLLYLNKMAAFAALESIGIAKTMENVPLIKAALDFTNEDFRNLAVDTGKPLTPQFKIGLFKLLGFERASKFLEVLPNYRALVFSIDDAIAEEERNKRGKKI